ncbi:hypothetical protein U2I54_28020, partial [Bacillus pseudomycoides]|nr:hypothetical protein [Bacillus pseudomycoides]
FLLDSRNQHTLKVLVKHSHPWEKVISPLHIKISNMQAELNFIIVPEDQRKYTAKIEGFLELKVWNQNLSEKVQILFETYRDGSNPGYIIGFFSPQDWIPDIIINQLKILRQLFQLNVELEKPGLLISTIDNFPISSSTLGQNLLGAPSIVKKDVTFFTIAKMSGSIIKILEPIFGQLNSFKLSAHLDGELNTPKIIAELPKNPEPKGFLQFEGIHFNIITSQTSFNIGGIIVLIIGEDRFDFQCHSSLNPNEMPDIILSLPEDKRHWNEPFGIKGVVLEDLGASIGFEEDGFNFGIIGKIVLGDDIQLEAGGEFANGGIPKAIIASLKKEPASPTELEEIPLTKLIDALTGLNSEWIPLLNKVIIRKFELYIVADPQGFRSPIDPNVIYQPGLSLYADSSLFGLDSIMHIEFNYEKGLYAKGQLGEPIRFSNILLIADASGEKGAIIIIDTRQLTQPAQDSEYLYLSASVSLFDFAKLAIEAHVKEEGFLFNIQEKLEGFGTVTMSCALYGKKRFVASTTIGFHLVERISLNKPVVTATFLIGHLFLDTGVHVTIEIDLNLELNEFLCKVTGNFSFHGEELTINFETKTEFPSLKDIKNLIIQHIKTKSWDYFSRWYDDPAQLLRDAGPLFGAPNGLVEIAIDKGELLRDVFHLSAADAAKAFKSADNYKIAEVMHYLRSTFGAEIADMNRYLKDAGYHVALEIAPGLVKLASLYDNQVVNIEDIPLQLKNIGSLPQEIAYAMYKSGYWDGKEITKKLNQLEFDLPQITEGLIACMYIGIRFPMEEMASWLNGLGFSSDLILEVYGNLFRLEPFELGKILELSGVPTEEIRNKLKIKFNTDWASDVSLPNLPQIDLSRFERLRIG